METLRGIGEAPRTIWKSSSIFLAGIAGDAVVRTRPRPRRGGARRLHQIVVEPAPVWLYVPDRRQVGGRGRPAARWALKSLAGARRRSQTGVARPLSSDGGKAGAAIGIITPAQIRSNGQNAPKGWTVFHLPSTLDIESQASRDVSPVRRRVLAVSCIDATALKGLFASLCRWSRGGGRCRVACASWRSARQTRRVAAWRCAAAHGSRRRLVPSGTGAAE